MVLAFGLVPIVEATPPVPVEAVTGRVNGRDRSFTYLPGGNVSVRYTRQ